MSEQAVGARLLLTERDAILPMLREADRAAFDRPTILPGWSVRDVLAHCAAALSMAGAGSGHGFSPAENQRDVDERKTWAVDAVLDELASGYSAAAAAMVAADGKLDGLALGEWLHGGDVRDALGIPDAYASAGLPDALVLFELISRQPRRAMPETAAHLPSGTLRLGSRPADATLRADAATFVRLLGGRSPQPQRYELVGADPEAYVIFH